MPLWKQLILLYAIFRVWDFGVEFPSTQFGFWNYYTNVKKIGTLPWHVPFGLALVNTGLYYIHKFARERSEGKSFIKGLGIHAAIYWSFLITGAAMAKLITARGGHRPDWPEEQSYPV